MRIALIFVGVLGLGITTQAFAAGEIVMFTPGSAICGDWGDEEPAKTEYRDWLWGYLSGVVATGIYGPKILDETSPTAAVVWAKDYCKQHTLDKISDAANALLVELKKRSLKK